VRGTLQRIEVERWGGEQTYRMVGSLKPSKTCTQVRKSSLDPPPLSFYFSHLTLPKQIRPQQYVRTEHPDCSYEGSGSFANLRFLIARLIRIPLLRAACKISLRAVAGNASGT